MGTAVRAGIFYFAVVFAVGFVLGTIRVLPVAPRLGEFGAVLLELPIMLAVSWIACDWLTRRLKVPTGIADRLVMGVLAFALLMLAELAVSTLAFGRGMSEHVAGYRALNAQLGLAAQIAFALFPLAQALLASRRQDAS